MGEWITKTPNSDGSYAYEVIAGKEKLPMSHVSLCSALRCCNWHEHGCPILQAGADSDAITEHGSYEFAADGTFTPNPHAHFSIPSQDEWLKAAYYKGNGLNQGYWNYPTQSNNNPGNNCGDITDQANYNARSWFVNPFLRLTNVDLFNDSKSFYGCRDMGGNVNEWTTTQDASGKYIVRGGSYESEYSYTGSNDLMITATPQIYLPGEANGLIGFRIEEKNLSEPIAASNDALLADAINEIKENGPGWTGAESAWAYAVVRGLYNLMPKKYQYTVHSLYSDENREKVVGPAKLVVGSAEENIKVWKSMRGTYLKSKLETPLRRPTYGDENYATNKGLRRPNSYPDWDAYVADVLKAHRAKDIANKEKLAEKLGEWTFGPGHEAYNDQFERIINNGWIDVQYITIGQTMTPERSCSIGIIEISKALVINGVAGAVIGAACSYAGEYSGEGIGYLLGGTSGAAEGKTIGEDIGTVASIILPWCLL
jgi:hypothetical protein